MAAFSGLQLHPCHGINQQHLLEMHHFQDSVICHFIAKDLPLINIETGPVLFFSFLFFLFSILKLVSFNLDICFPPFSAFLSWVVFQNDTYISFHLFISPYRAFIWLYHTAGLLIDTQTSDREAFVLVSAASSFTINPLRCVDARKCWKGSGPISSSRTLAWHLFKSFVGNLFSPSLSRGRPLSLWFEFHISRWSDCLIA